MTTLDQPGLEIGKPAKILPFGAKAKRFIRRRPEEDARINILVGSVRSGKTWSLTAKKLLHLCNYQVGGYRIITGVSKSSIYKNVLNDLFEIAGTENYAYNRQSGELTIFGVKWQVIGARDEGSEKDVRGLTVGVAICDELVLMPQSFFKMLVTRMSPAGARLYASTNPDSPYHWLKTDVIDNEKLSHGFGGKDVWSETWALEDNPNIEDKYKEFVRRSYVGVFYDRFVLGKWVLAEGTIYRDVLTSGVFYTDATRPVGLRGRGGHVDRCVAIDYGTTNPCVFCDIYDDGETVWADREYYWDSKRERRQKTDSEYGDDLEAFCGGRDNQAFWPSILIDPSAASFRMELLSRGFHVTEADNEVEDGIRRVSTMLGRFRLRINTDGCPEIKREMETYAWDTKKSEKGTEQPIKAHDHGPDLLRYFTKTKISDYRLAA